MSQHPTIIAKREAQRLQAENDGLRRWQQAALERRDLDRAEIERLQAGNAERDTRIARLVEDNQCIPLLQAEIERLRAAGQTLSLKIVEMSDQYEALDDVRGRLRAALTQISGFAKVMDENNWRDLRLHIERQCSDEQSKDTKNV